MTRIFSAPTLRLARANAKLSGLILLYGLLSFAFGCAGSGVDDSNDNVVDATWKMSIPNALALDCAAPPADLSAELWVSGNRDSCPMDVDLSAETTSGSCTVAPGRVRTVTLDWFVTRTAPGGVLPMRVLLAQAQGQIDLQDVSESEVTWSVTEDDIRLTQCLDMTEDPAGGASTVAFDGESRPVCDLNGSCGGVEAAACSNLGELCNGGDPLAAP
jgi:hypothetical protein